MKRMILHSYIIIQGVLFTGCFKSHNATIKTSCSSVFLEVYNRYPDCRDYYLTDSTNFRTFFLAIDLEHEYFHYDCKGDTIFLEKFGYKSNTDTVQQLIDKKTFDIKALRKEKKFNKISFFEN